MDYNTFIKKLVVLITTLIVVLLLGIAYINNDTKDLLAFQIQLEKLNLLDKDVQIELNNIYNSNIVNYDILNDTNKKLMQHIDKMISVNQSSEDLDEIKKNILLQVENIDLIKRGNSLINNSFYYMKFLSDKTLNYKDLGNDTLRLQKINRVLLDLSYEIKSADKFHLKKYKKNLDIFKNIKVTKAYLTHYKKSIYPHFLIIYKNATILHDKSINDEYLRKNIYTHYLKLRNKTIKEQLNKEKNEQYIVYLEVILFILTILLVALIYKLLAQTKTYLNEQKKLQKLISKNIITSTTDLKGIITSVSDAYCDISGYSRDELIGQPHNIIRHPDMPVSAFKGMWKTIQTGKVWRGNVKNLKKNGDFYWVEAVIEPLFDKYGKIESYLALRVDITSKVKLDELSKSQESIIQQAISNIKIQKIKLQSALKTKSEFLANMSHEIRTPLNAILGFVDLLKDECKDEKPLEYLSIIDSSSKSLLQIIEDILDFSKIESGKLDIEKIDFNAKEEFEIVTNLFMAKASEKNISLILNLDSTLPKTINTDPLRIKQVISNLLSNAIKFTPSGKRIYIDINYKKNHFHVSVKDEGKGIAKDKLSHIFESFSQEDSSTTREFGGTGLGLTISSALVKLLGGELKVKSELGVGSEFYFSLPVTIGKDILKTTQDIKDVVFEDKKILLVEDNKANQIFMKVVLKKLQLDYDVVDDGLEAIKAFKENRYDAILMDENMPNMNGIEATKRILEIEKEHNLAHTPIIALTANAIKGDRERFLDAGMDEYLTKPINKKKLAEVLGKILIKEYIDV